MSEFDMTQPNANDNAQTAPTNSVQPATGTVAQVPQAGQALNLKELDLRRIPAYVLQRLQSKMVNGKSLVETFDDMVHQFYINNVAARYGFTDIGVSGLLADANIDKMRYVPERNAWYIYDAVMWSPDNGAAMELCKEFAMDLRVLIDAVPFDGTEKRKQIVACVKKLQTRRGRETVLKDAATVHPVRMSDFDQDPFILNCLNGTLDMWHGTFRRHDPADLLTKIANVCYDPCAICDRWVQHINEVMMGDREKVQFLQQALGYALTGDTRYECFFILYGPTSRNGKSLTMGTFATLLGDYARSTKPETITQRQVANGAGPSEDLARMAGARFINIPEPDKKMVLSSALVKTLTGNDVITARFLHENSFEFKLQAKLFMNTNHLPRVTDSTVFRSERVKVIMFERHFEPHEQDPTLKEVFAQPQNLSGILNWCLEGMYSLYQNGFVQCSSVQLATEEYQQDSDYIGRYIDENLVASPNSEFFMEAVYTDYKRWCEDNGYQPLSQSNFSKDMKTRVTVVRKRPTGQPGNARSTLVGYALRTPLSPDPQS